MGNPQFLIYFFITIIIKYLFIYMESKDVHIKMKKDRYVEGRNDDKKKGDLHHLGGPRHPVRILELITK